MNSLILNILFSKPQSSSKYRANSNWEDHQHRKGNKQAKISLFRNNLWVTSGEDLIHGYEKLIWLQVTWTTEYRPGEHFGLLQSESGPNHLPVTCWNITCVKQILFVVRLKQLREIRDWSPLNKRIRGSCGITNFKPCFYTFCCSLPENILSLMQKCIHFIQSIFTSVDMQPFASKGHSIAPTNDH